VSIVLDAKACLLRKERGERGARGREKRRKDAGGSIFGEDGRRGEGEIRTDGRRGGRYMGRLLGWGPGPLAMGDRTATGRSESGWGRGQA